MNAFATVRIHNSNAIRSAMGKRFCFVFVSSSFFFFFELTNYLVFSFIFVVKFHFHTQMNSSHASSYNCEMSDLDQSELKLNVHFTRTNDRDYWLFSWVYDVTCRDRVATIGGSNRANNDRRMDIFREKDGKRILYALCT